MDSIKGDSLPHRAKALKTEGVYMNESGEFVKKSLNYYKSSPEELLLIHDDLDLPLGEVRLQKNRSSAGHKGVQSVIDTLGTQDFFRLRIGIGRPTDGDAEKWVLEDFNREEMKEKEKAIEKALELVSQWLRNG